MPNPRKRRDKPAESQSQPVGKDREGRRYAVTQHKGRASGKVRYIETNDPSKGCRFL